MKVYYDKLKFLQDKAYRARNSLPFIKEVHPYMYLSNKPYPKDYRINLSREVEPELSKGDIVEILFVRNIGMGTLVPISSIKDISDVSVNKLKLIIKKVEYKDDNIFTYNEKTSHRHEYYVKDNNKLFIKSRHLYDLLTKCGIKNLDSYDMIWDTIREQYIVHLDSEPETLNEVKGRRIYHTRNVILLKNSL